MNKLIYGLLILLAIFHQDFWWWDDSDTLVLGFMPIGLFYHAMISVSAGLLWWLAVKYCWPKGLDDADEVQDPAQGGTA